MKLIRGEKALEVMGEVQEQEMKSGVQHRFCEENILYNSSQDGTFDY